MSVVSVAYERSEDGFKTVMSVFGGSNMTILQVFSEPVSLFMIPTLGFESLRQTMLVCSDKIRSSTVWR